MPDNNYIIFEKWIFPIFKQMLMEQETQVKKLLSEHPLSIMDLRYSQI